MQWAFRFYFDGITRRRVRKKLWSLSLELKLLLTFKHLLLCYAITSSWRNPAKSPLSSRNVSNVEMF